MHRIVCQKQKKTELCQYLADCKYPDGFCSSMSKCVNIEAQKVLGLKTHDCNILSQSTFPAGLRRLVASDIYQVVADLGKFFKELCSKSLEVAVLHRLKKEIPIILCRLENIFPSSFFDVMLHLAVHLPDEALL